MDNAQGWPATGCTDLIQFLIQFGRAGLLPKTFFVDHLHADRLRLLMTETAPRAGPVWIGADRVPGVR